MDNNTPGGEKKIKRPRIGALPAQNSYGDAHERPNYERPHYQRRDNENAEEGENRRPYQSRPYQQHRPYQGGYHQRRNYSEYNNANAEAKPDNDDTNLTTTEGGEQQQQYQGGYRQQGYRQYNNGYRQQGGYRQNGYNRQGGYNNNRQGGGYRSYNNNFRQQGEGGYNRQQGEGGYNRPQQNGEGGFRQQRPGGYRQQRPGGYNNRPQQGGNRFNNRRNEGFGGKSFTPRPKRIEYEMPIPDPDEQIRLNKFMSNAGICSRREADEFIRQGLVKVNGEVVTELGTKISHSDVVEYDEKVVAMESKCYVLLNKPKDCVTTSDDPQGRTTVMDIVKGCCNERIYPVGRLDRNTTGVLLLTNDGDLASKLTHPKYVKKKIYHVWCDKDIAEDDMQRIADGIELEDGPIHADAISYATETDRNQAGIEIHSGRNRIVRRIFESLGYHVTKLDRVYFAGLTKKNLPRGRWRYLTQEEVNHLKMGAFE